MNTSHNHQHTPAIPGYEYIAAAAPSKQSRKRLRFNPTVTVQPIDCMMTEEEKSHAYYSKSELKAISLCKEQPPHASSACGAHAMTQDCVIGLEADPALRGLERYLCPVRVQNKVLARKTLKKYSERISADPRMTDEQKLRSLAAVSAKLSQWSKSVALETARLDSLRAYDGDYLIPIDGPVDILPFPATTKRRRVCSDEDSLPAKRRR